MSKMIEGIKIEFSKTDNNYFESTYDDDINVDILIISLLETINDICNANGLDCNEQLLNYLSMGSIDNYTNQEEKDAIFSALESKDMKKYKGKL